MKKLFKIFFLIVGLLSALHSSAQVAYDITWYYEGVKYRGLIVPQENEWWMRVRYVANGLVNMVDQTLEPAVYEDGIALHGCCPVYAGTYTRHRSYQADNFLLYEDRYGNNKMYNVDNAGQSSAIYSVTPIYTNTQYQKTLSTSFRQ